MNIRLAGFDGQGIVVAGYVWGYGGILDGRNALQTQSCGGESRGGTCKSDVIISPDEICDLAPSPVDVLVAMSQPALDQCHPSLKKGGILIYDRPFVRLADGGSLAFGLPATDIAHRDFGHAVVANMIMLGCLAGLTGVASRGSLRRAITESVPAKMVDVNLKAFDDGLRRGAEHERRSREEKG